MCLIFNFWMIRHQFRQIAKCKIAFFGIVVHFNLQILKIIHLVCLSFWGISRHPGFRISISVQKMWPYAHHITNWPVPPWPLGPSQTFRQLLFSAKTELLGNSGETLGELWRNSGGTLGELWGNSAGSDGHLPRRKLAKNNIVWG